MTENPYRDAGAIANVWKHDVWNEGYNQAIEDVVAKVREAGWLQAFQSFEEFEALKKVSE